MMIGIALSLVTPSQGVVSSLSHFITGTALGNRSGKKVYLWGDSTTTLATTYLADMAAYVSSEQPLQGATVTDFGTNGATLLSQLSLTPSARNLGALIAATPDLVVICFGINDVRLGLTDAATLLSRLRTAIDAIRSALPTCDIVLWTPNSLGSTDDGYVTATGLFSGMTVAQAAQAATDILRNAYATLLNAYANAVSLSKQAVDQFGPTSLLSSPLMTDSLHPNGPGQIMEAAQLVGRIGTPALTIPSVLYSNISADVSTYAQIGQLSVAAGETDPLGGTTAYLLTADGTAGNHYRRVAFNPGAGVNPAQKMIFDAKAGSLGWLKFSEDWTGGSSWFNLSTGAVGTKAAGHTVRSWDRGNGWFRYEVTFNMTGGANWFNFSPVAANNNSEASGQNGTIRLFKPQTSATR